MVKLFLSIISLSFFVLSDTIQFIPLNRSQFVPRKSAKYYGGAGLLAKGGPVSIKWSSCYHQDTCELFFMYPGKKDSSVFLFHNRNKDFIEDSIVELGSFVAGTSLFFRLNPLTSNDVTSYTPVGTKIYSGLDRVGIDPYVSDIICAQDWSALGRIDQNTIDLSFEIRLCARNYQAIITEVTNAYLEGIEKFKIPFVHFNKSSQMFKDKITIQLSLPLEGLKYVVFDQEFKYSENSANGVRIYYTTDGTNPVPSSNHYNGSITITQTTTIKAIALIEGDTNWFPSEMVSETYTREGEVSVNGMLQSKANHRLNFYGKENYYFDIAGRQIPDRYKQRLKGVFLTKSSVNGSCKRHVNTDFN